MEREYRDEKWLSRKYLDEDYSVGDIAGEFGVEPSTITYWLQKHNINDRESSNESHNSVKWLREKYLGDGLTCKEISELSECSVGESTIQREISIHGIANEGGERKYIRISKQRGVSEDSKHLDPNWMYQKYVEEKLTIRDIAEIQSVDVSPSSVHRALKAFGIDTRPSLSVEGEENPWYKHGNSYQEYGEDWDEIRKDIRRRDEYTCQNCGIKQREHLHMFDIRLDVHHITPLSEFDDIDRANEYDNLATLCRSCHRMVEHGTIDLTD